MLVALIAVSCIAVLLLALVAHLATRPSPESRRERLLERDVARLQNELLDAHDKLLHVVEKPWNVTPADVEQYARDREPPPDDDEDDEHPILSHDELADDLLLVPDLPEVDAYAGAY